MSSAFTQGFSGQLDTIFIADITDFNYGGLIGLDGQFIYTFKAIRT